MVLTVMWNWFGRSLAVSKDAPGVIEYDPVYGLSRTSLDDWLVRNPELAVEHKRLEAQNRAQRAKEQTLSPTDDAFARDRAVDTSYNLGVKEMNSTQKNLTSADERGDNGQFQPIDYERDLMSSNSDRRMTQVLATVAHEMRNPLSALTYAIETLKLDSGRSHMVAFYNVMQSQVQQLTMFCEDLLDNSRLTLAKMRLKLEPVDVRQLIDNALDQIRPLIDERGHIVSVHFPPEPITVNGDKLRLTQVYANLIRNAAKFTDPDGQLRIEVSVTGDNVVVCIGDNGHGIESHRLTAIFDAFVQDENGDVSTNDGMGIGLLVVKGIVELHGGAVEAHSDGIGRGSEFVVRMPCANSHAPSASSFANVNDHN